MTADQIHKQSIIIDGLNASYFLDPEVVQGVHRGGVTAVNATVAVWHTLPETVRIIAELYSKVEQYRDTVTIIRSINDITAAKSNGKVGIILGFQDIGPIEDDLRLLAVYHALGVRVIQITYNDPNRAGCGCLAPEDTGLTDWGKRLVSELNRLGIVIDLSHVGERTGREAIDSSAKPVAFTHANARTRVDHPRNKSDEAIKALAARGGVVGAVAFPAMLTGRMDATLDDYLEMIGYLVEIAGVDHVGIGADFMERMPRELLLQALGGGTAGPPPEERIKLFLGSATKGFESAAAFPNVTRGLLARGYSTADTEKIMGENWVRLFRDVWNAGKGNADSR